MNEAPPARFAPSAPRWQRIGLPIASVLLGSLVTIVPMIASHPVLPPFGLMMLLGWRLLRPELFKIWAAAPFGLFDDLVSGQPLGSVTMPTNSSPEEAMREMTVLDDGTILLALRLDEGMSFEGYRCP